MEQLDEEKARKKENSKSKKEMNYNEIRTIKKRK